MITLVLGGARSGKSEVGERLASALGPNVTYVATAIVDLADDDLADDDLADDDFGARIEKHRARRPSSWTTVEAGADLPAVLADLDGPVLVDSLGTWVAACAEPDADALCHALATRVGDTVVVSDEVGLGVHPSSEAGRRFRDLLGTVNRLVADVADDVLLVVAGRVLPLARP